MTPPVKVIDLYNIQVWKMVLNEIKQWMEMPSLK